ncbi:MAG: FHA domain-containing protein [Lachnospiraceae bacterium]|nr:FHA domain-containing protein [Lachnospiraceae bacterium]
MNKKEIIAKIVIAVMLVLSLATMFLSYTGLTEKDLVAALKENFPEFKSTIDDVEEKYVDDEKEIIIIKSTSGLKTLDNISDFDSSGYISQIKKLKIFTMTAMITSWSALFIALVSIIVFKKKIKYILSLVFSFIGAFSMCSVALFIPDMARDAIIALTDKEISESSEFVAIVLIFLKSRIGTRVADFTHDILMKTLNFGYWLCIIFAGLAFILSITGLIIMIIKKKNKSKTAAKLMGLRGVYEGAEIDMGQVIIIGRDPSVAQLVISKENISRKHCKIEFNENTGKYIVTDYSSNGTFILNGRRLDENVPTELEKGTIIELGRNGDTFRLS